MNRRDWPLESDRVCVILVNYAIAIADTDSVAVALWSWQALNVVTRSSDAYTSTEIKYCSVALL